MENNHTHSSAIILVVDDDEAARRNISVVLRQDGLTRILEASSGAEAIRLLSKLDAIDLVITDLRLPEMDGLAMVYRIKQNFPSIPVVYVSMHPEPDGLLHDEPYCQFVRKPFAPDTLLDAVRKCLTPVPPAGSESRPSALQ